MEKSIATSKVLDRSVFLPLLAAATKSQANTLLPDNRSRNILYTHLPVFCDREQAIYNEFPLLLILIFTDHIQITHAGIVILLVILGRQVRLFLDGQRMLFLHLNTDMTDFVHLLFTLVQHIDALFTSLLE